MSGVGDVLLYGDDANGVAATGCCLDFQLGGRGDGASLDYIVMGVGLVMGVVTVTVDGEIGRAHV